MVERRVIGFGQLVIAPCLCCWYVIPCCLQIAKLLIIPFVCCVERFYLGRQFTRETVGAIGVVVVVS